MIKIILLSTILHSGEIIDNNYCGFRHSDPLVVEARKRGKGKRDRRRGGNGLR